MGPALMAWYGNSTSPPGLVVGIIDEFSPGIWEIFPWLRPTYIDQGTASSLDQIRLGDFLRVRPVTGSPYLWEATGHYFNGSGTGPSTTAFYIVFGRPPGMQPPISYEEYHLLGSLLPFPCLPCKQVPFGWKPYC